MKKRVIKKILVLFISVFVLLGGYHLYSHYMVSKFFKCIDAGNTSKTISCIKRMPNVNMLDKCHPLYDIEAILLQYSTSEGYPLYYAIWNEADTRVIKALLEKGADPNKKDVSFSQTPLECLCDKPQDGMYEKVKLLVEYGADVSDGKNLLHMSVYYYRFYTYKETKDTMLKTVTYLWEHGASEYLDAGTESETSILHEAAAYMDTYYLEKFYHNEKRPMTYLLNAQDVNGETPLFWAVREGKLDNCLFLIEEGARIDIQNNEGKTAYDIAMDAGHRTFARNYLMK